MFGSFRIALYYVNWKKLEKITQRVVLLCKLGTPQPQACQAAILLPLHPTLCMIIVLILIILFIFIIIILFIYYIIIVLIMLADDSVALSSLCLTYLPQQALLNEAAMRLKLERMKRLRYARYVDAFCL